ncbi:hypothetical protein [Chamaesiphon sp. VAR_48_metabat_135_sub]|uniref:hypothetical protein n=1 Tax=Chamaesiphon sp. VAR_48_metabat_135_sub TaxID=2964699 RepID=UPI00286BE3B3|nr:hypothetical protein [Chamaesiphon sp. VAR_48_metabat_135_sub]
MVIICFILTWVTIISACLTLAHNWKTGFIYVKRLHQVPCHNCKYFTNSCYLKCTVNPHLACSEEAIDCRDYQPQ